MSAKVDTRIQNFYLKGYTDAMDNCHQFISAVTDRFGYIKMEKDLTLRQFLVTMRDELNKAHGSVVTNKET